MRLSEDGKTLLKVTQHDFANGTFIIPDSVTHIGDWAFSDCNGLTRVSIPNSVTHIGDWAFGRCTGLTEVSIPNSVTHIGHSAFNGCTGLTEITIPDSVTHIGDCAFNRCISLTQLCIPNSVTHIGDSAFYGCIRLTQLCIPNSVTHIGASAFYGCTGLTQVSIPNSVIEIGDGAFANCSTNLVIIIDALNEQAYERISGLVPQKSRHLIMDFGLTQEINQAKQKALTLIKPFAMSSFPEKLPEELISIIWQMEGRLHEVINRVPLPRQSIFSPRPQSAELDEYKKALQQVVKQFSLEQEPLLPKFVADKLQQYVDRTNKTINEAREKNKRFFDSPEKKEILTESKARMAVVEKLIAWLSGDKNICFNENEKTLLRNPKSIVASILEKNGVSVEKLPKAPSSGRSLNK
jgi:hypothetical protein